MSINVPVSLSVSISIMHDSEAGHEETEEWRTGSGPYIPDINIWDVKTTASSSLFSFFMSCFWVILPKPQLLSNGDHICTRTRKEQEWSYTTKNIAGRWSMYSGFEGVRKVQGDKTPSSPGTPLVFQPCAGTTAVLERWQKLCQCYWQSDGAVWSLLG